MAQLTTYKAVPSGMSFDLDTSAARTACLLSTPGNAAVVALTGDGSWSVEVLTSVDGLNFSQLALLTTPGVRRYDTRGVAQMAVRVVTWAPGAGILSGQLTHGALIPATNVSPLFGSFLTFSYNNTAAEPPTGNQVRFDNANFTLARKAWIANSTVDGVDQYFALRHVPFGGTLLLQNKGDHTGAVLFQILAPPIDKLSYVEVPIAYQQGISNLTSQQVILAVFAPGPTMSFSVVAANAYLSPDILPLSAPHPHPHARSEADG